LLQENITPKISTVFKSYTTQHVTLMQIHITITYAADTSSTIDKQHNSKSLKMTHISLYKYNSYSADNDLIKKLIWVRFNTHSAQ